MGRYEIYNELSKRVIAMRHSEERSVFEAYELSLYEKLSGLTDAVFGDMLTLGEAKHKLQAYILSLSPKEGSVRL